MPRGAWWSQTFVNDGGPLLILPHELVGHWPGSRSDYDRACDARRPFDFFPAGPGFVVVAASTAGPFAHANWLRLADQPGITLVAWDDSDEAGPDWLVARLARPDVRWHRHRPRMTVGAGVLLLQHAAGPASRVQFRASDDFARIGQTVPVGILSGRYALETLNLDEEAGAERYVVGLCRWVPIG